MLVMFLGAQGIAIGALDVLTVELAQGVLHRGGDWAGYSTRHSAPEVSSRSSSRRDSSG